MQNGIGDYLDEDDVRFIADTPGKKVNSDRHYYSRLYRILSRVVYAGGGESTEQRDKRYKTALDICNDREFPIDLICSQGTSITYHKRFKEYCERH